MSPSAVSWRPEDFVEGGIVPVDKNLTWKNPHFTMFDYTRKDGTVAATTVAAAIGYVDDDGQETVQNYSVGDPKRFAPSEDGKTIVALVEGAKPSKSSNFYLLIQALINAGFPANRIPESGDISVLDGLYAHHIGMPEPKRTGLVRAPAAEGQPERERVLSVPDRVIRLPGEKAAKGAKTGAAAAKAAKAEAPDAEAVAAEALAFVAAHLDDSGVTTRQKLASAVLKELKDNPNKDAIAGLIFAPAFKTRLIAEGYTVEGEKITKSEE